MTFTVTYEEYFEKYAITPEKIASFSKAFAEKGIDNYLFKEDSEQILSNVVNDFNRYHSNCLVIPVENKYFDYPNKFAIFTKEFEPLRCDEITVESYERILRFGVRIDKISSDENGMFRMDIRIYQKGYSSKDREFWSKYNIAEKININYVECKGLSQLNADGKKHCAKITKDSSEYCQWCHEIIVEELYGDCEPEYSELDQGAEDEAFIYMRLENDIEISRGNMPPYNV